MTSPLHPQRAPLIVAVVVLYRMHATESPAYRALQAASQQIADTVEVVLWDNTPAPSERPQDFAGTYHHDPSNPGLAAAYDFALAQARQNGARWLMLLDQDTEVIPEYLQEVVTVAGTSSADVLVPRLISERRTLSPFRPVLHGPAMPLEATLAGDVSGLQAFNSGAIFSVEHLVKVGGFDRDFPLDYLDHASFARLHAAGGRMHLLNARLEHELASQASGPLSDGALARERSVLAAERRFVRRYGSAAEQCAYPLRMVRRAASVLLHKRDVRNALSILRTLAGLNP